MTSKGSTNEVPKTELWQEWRHTCQLVTELRELQNRYRAVVEVGKLKEWCGEKCHSYICNIVTYFEALISALENVKSNLYREITQSAKGGE